jgi:hypothetical protein
MGPASPPLQIGSWSVQVGKNIDVGKIGANDQSGGAERRSPAQSAPGERGAGERVADRVYSSLASRSICTLPCKAVETGQPRLASSAALAKPA